MKANVDGAMVKEGTGGGLGVIFRDEDGAFRGAASHFLPDCPKAETTELLSCRKAVQLAIQRGIQKLHLETDSQAVAKMIGEEGRNLSPVGQMIEEVKNMIRTREEFKITWVRRTANGATHILAKLGVTSRTSVFWDLDPPVCILSTVSDEIPTLS
ncbi:hypothetical protein ACQJBY_061477 [Aegilops geniculata]